jgi:hypothetical protein
VTLNGSPEELHAFWDDALGTGNAQNIIQSVIIAAKKLPAVDPALASKSSEQDWVTESLEAAQATVYSAPIGPGNGPFTLTAAYKADARAVAGQRIALAGARLANLINNELN